MTASPPSLESAQVFFGQVSSAQAHLYVRIEHVDPSEGWALGGWIRGPRCRHRQTLEAKIPLLDAGPGVSLLAQAIVPDPCCWTPDAPFIYLVRLELTHGENKLGKAERLVGIRPCGVVKNRLLLDQHAWQPRAVRVENLAVADLALWRDVKASLYVDNPSEELCQEASLHGVVLIARLTGDLPQVLELLKRVGRWPAVVVAVLDANPQLPADLRKDARNTLLAIHTSAHDSEDIPSWAQLAVLEDEPDSIIAVAERSELPVLACIPHRQPITPENSGAALQEWQSRFAGEDEIVGWIV